MSKNYCIKFTCSKCGSNRLAFHEYVKSITPAEFMSCGKLYYTPATIDEDDFMPEARGFRCRDCGHMLERCGHQITMEKELFDYLSMDPVVREKEQGEYDEHLKVVIDEQDAQESEQEY
jgi:hypothetical protein